MNPRPTHLIAVALVLCAPASAQLAGEDIAQDTPNQLEHVFERGPARAGTLLGLLELPVEIGEGRLDGVLLDEDGLPLFGLEADLSIYVPTGNQSARFVYGGMYGRISALSAEAGMNEALVQGEWSRFGFQSPNGELHAVVYVATPAGPRGLGTLRADMLLDTDSGGVVEPVVEPGADPIDEAGSDPTVPPLSPGLHSVLSQRVGAHASPHFELGLGGMIVDPDPYGDPTIVEVQKVGPYSEAHEAPIVALPSGSSGDDGSSADGSILAGPNHGSFAGTWRIHTEL